MKAFKEWKTLFILICRIESGPRATARANTIYRRYKNQRNSSLFGTRHVPKNGSSAMTMYIE